MSKLLFRLNGVSDDEANDVRAILDQHELPYYETSAGRWGLSVAAIWLKDDDRLQEAKEYLALYQQQRAEQFHNAPPSYPSIWQRIRQAPLYFLLLIIAILAVLYLSTIPFIAV